LEKSAFEEKCMPALPPAFSLPLSLVACVGLVMLYYWLVPLDAPRFLHYMPLVLVAAVIYLWYRYGQMVHVYRLEKGRLIIRRGRTSRNLDFANLSESMLILFCSKNYAGSRRPQGDIQTLNACSSLFRSMRKAWKIYCKNEEGTIFCILFEPTQEFLTRLKEEFPDKFVK
jgi:hypothetical protein